MESTTDSTFGEVPNGLHAMAVMGKEGDTKHMWDKTKPAEVEAAKTLFDSLRGKGYAAFQVKGKDGERGEIMREFDPTAERIIFAPQLQGG